jgi:hypothetical protein
MRSGELRKGDDEMKKIVKGGSFYTLLTGITKC